MNLDNVYWDWNAMRRDGRFPSILAIGDSWFWYPLPGGSLITQLGRLVDKKQHAILAIGNNGAEAFDYIHGKYEKAVRTALALHGDSLSAVFISGGGNDFAGFNDLRPLLNDDCSEATTPDQCFRRGDKAPSLRWLLGKTGDSYRALIGRILVTARPETVIILHNYDVALPTGKGVFGSRGSWLKPALDDARVPARLQRACMRHLIDRMTAELKAVAAPHGGRIVVIESAGTLGDDDWANELHPKATGFRKIATQCWRPALVALGLA